MTPATAPLDDFLAGAGESTSTGDLLQQVGLVGSLLGVSLAGGLVVFLAAVHRGGRDEIAALLRIVLGAGVLLLIGAVVEIAGQASIDGIGWSEALTDGATAAPMMRLLAGLLVVLGLFDHSIPVDDEQVRWIPASASAFGYAGVAIGVLSFSFDGHTVTEGPRAVHAIANVVHVSAGSVWVGGVVGLCVIAWRRRRNGSTAELLLRFSSIAGIALVIVALVGAVMTLMIIDDFGVLTATDWGRLLIMKAVIVAIAAMIGGYNHFVVVPALEAADSRAAAEARARRSVTVEAVVLLSVVVLTTWLTASSAN